MSAKFVIYEFPSRNFIARFISRFCELNFRKHYNVLIRLHRSAFLIKTRKNCGTKLKLNELMLKLRNFIIKFVLCNGYANVTFRQLMSVIHERIINIAHRGLIWKLPPSSLIEFTFFLHNYIRRIAKENLGWLSAIRPNLCSKRSFHRLSSRKIRI